MLKAAGDEKDELIDLFDKLKDLKQIVDPLHLNVSLAEAKAEAKTLLGAQLETLKKDIENTFSTAPRHFS